MTYLMSDIHGDYENFCRIREMAGVSDDDKLYILGDLIDRGEKNLKLLGEVRNCPNIVLLKGNHELFAEMYLDGSISGRRWDSWGGKSTRKELDKLSSKEAEELQDYFYWLPKMEKITCEGKQWILTHTGYVYGCSAYNENGTINTEKTIQKAMAKNEFNYLTSNDLYEMNPEKEWDTTLIVGHYPVGLMRKNEGIVTFEKNYINLDAGNGYRSKGGRLACYCLETGEVWYV
ncbi:metallophosphoesterase [Lachnoclostridium sp. An181]|uniref:metallophosphoesterase n=1 Tax=Lachnoclostridium sp. An181 TaxID=1965575 RepID=UPI0013A64FCE|nr:metallophosphoesterase [Lachnoclostridium sp. An181]